MKDHAVDELIPQPEGGLTPYRRAVDLALGRVDADAIETSWQDSEVSGAPSDPLPSDPDWAGRTVFTDARTLVTSASRRPAVVRGAGHRWNERLVLLAVPLGGARADGPRGRRGGPAPRSP